MNQARKSAVIKLPSDSVDFSLVQSLCTQTPDTGNATTPKPGKWVDFKRVLTKVSQSCDEMLSKLMIIIEELSFIELFSDLLLNYFGFFFQKVACTYGGFEVECMEIFSSILTDEGLCCIFNGLSQKYSMKDKYG